MPTCLSDLAGSTQGSGTTPTSVTIGSGSQRCQLSAWRAAAPTPTLKSEGQQVTFTGTVSLTRRLATPSYSGAVYVGNVTDTAQNATASSASNPRGAVDSGAFQLVDASGQSGDRSTAATRARSHSAR